MKHNLILVLLISLLFFGCKNYQKTILISENLNSKNETIDYSKSENWAVLPGNYPESLKKYPVLNPQDSIDVFYVYPTLIVSNKDKRWNVPIEDAIQREKVIQSPVQFQASAWANSGNLYVPFYRQAHVRAYDQLENGGTKALLFAYSDVKAAFTYYLEHYNHGHGIILAGHSQGSTHLSRLLNDFFDNKSLQKQLVAAYIPGIGIDSTRYKTIPFMKNASQTGGFVTWNTFKKKFDLQQYKWYKGKVVINPVTWDTTSIAKRNLHKGFLFSNGKIYSNSFDTHRDNGVLWISTPHFPFRYLAFTLKNYHVGDVNLFWEDIRQNSLLRVQEFIKKRTAVAVQKNEILN